MLPIFLNLFYFLDAHRTIQAKVKVLLASPTFGNSETINPFGIKLIKSSIQDFISVV